MLLYYQCTLSENILCKNTLSEIQFMENTLLQKIHFQEEYTFGKKKTLSKDTLLERTQISLVRLCHILCLMSNGVKERIKKRLQYPPYGQLMQCNSRNKCNIQTNNAVEVPRKCDNIYRLRSLFQRNAGKYALTQLRPNNCTAVHKYLL